MRTRILKILILVVGLLPAAALVAGAFTDNLGANPIEFITHETGTFALGFLILTLAVTPIRRLSGWHEIIRLRRMLGLFAFFYASLHLLTWVVLDQFFDAPAMIEDIAKRPYITVGMFGFLCMVPLALTSTAAMVRRLGRRWQTLHRLTYLAAIAGVIHFWWLVKADIREPQRWAAILTLLLGLRAFWSLRRPVRLSFAESSCASCCRVLSLAAVSVNLVSSTRSDPAAAPLVLIVEDDMVTRVMYRDYLADSGFRIVDAHNGHQALAKARELAPDAIVTDLAVPGMDGFEFCRALKQSVGLRDIPILAVTGHSEYLDQPDRFQQAGIAQVLVKPCSPDLIVRELRRLLERHASPSTVRRP